MAGLAIPRRRLISIIGGSAGNLVEWYDWFAYASFAIYFAPVFFPKADPTAQLLSTATIFAVGFVLRPIGAWVMGRFADARGRKAGEFLLASILERARAMAMDRLYLLTNSKCASAIHLYEKLGFVHDAEIMAAYGSRYERCNVAMSYPL